MAEQTGIEKVGGKPKDETKAVAGGIAITVVIILMIAWGYFFIKKIQNGTQQVSLSSGAQDEFNPKNVKEAQQMLQTTLNPNQDLQDLRNQSQSGGAQAQQQIVQQPVDGGPDQFTNPNAQ